MANRYVSKTFLSVELWPYHCPPAQLKVNLMPVWKPAAAAVAGVAQRTGGGEEVWPVLFSELAPASRGECSPSEVAIPSWSSSIQKKTVEDDKWKEEEKTWRNPGYGESRRLLRSEGLPSGVKQLVDVSCGMPF